MHASIYVFFLLFAVPSAVESGKVWLGVAPRIYGTYSWYERISRAGNTKTEAFHVFQLCFS